MKNKKKIILGVLVGVLIGSIIGITYAIFSYTATSNNEQLITGDIYMHYKESNTLTLENALPSSTYDSTKYFEFTIDGKNTNTKYDIYYDILLNRGDVPTGKQETNRIQDKFIKFRLVEVVNNEETEIFTNKSYNDLSSSKRIHVATIPKNTMSEITHRYRLYMWIGNEVVIGNTGTAGIDYDMTTWNNLFASIKVSSTGDFTEKELPVEPELLKEHIINNVGSEGIVAINTNGELANDGDTVRDYRYSGGGRYCIYTDGEETYKLQIEDGNTCPASATYGSIQGQTRLWSPTVDPIVSEWNQTVSGTTYNLSTTNNTVQETNTVKNYVTFNGELWRIIGIVDGNIKLIKNTPLTSVPETDYTNNNGKTFEIRAGQPGGLKYPWYYWNRPKTGSETNNWADSGTMYYLNEENGYYGTINSTYKNMIQESTYYLSNVIYNSGTASTLYNEERENPVECGASVTYNSHNNSCNIWNGNEASWNGNIATLYVSDYGYAASSDMWNTDVSSYYSGGANRIFEKNWLLATDAFYMYFLSPSSSTPTVVPNWYGSGFINNWSVGSGNAWRPVLNLKSNTLVYSGDGSYNNPYKLIQE